MLYKDIQMKTRYWSKNAHFHTPPI